VTASVHLAYYSNESIQWMVVTSYANIQSVHRL
jgi:hypothetical protein